MIQQQANVKNKTAFTLWGKFSGVFFSERNQSPRRKLFNSIWAIIFGLVISGIIVSISGHNPFLFFTSLFNEGLTTYGNKLIPMFVAYIMAGLGVAICFKSGLFNIGISGQMMAGGFTTLVIFRSELLTKTSISASSIVLALFVAIMIGALVAVIAGMLKTTFGVNEVVSTIMLNWIIFFVIKFLVIDLASLPYQVLDTDTGKIVTKYRDFLADGSSLSSNLSLGYTLPNFFFPTDLNNSWFTNSWNWIILSIALVMVVATWFLLSKTRFGYKIRMIGLNKDAAEYSGTNKNSLILIVMAISGAFCGLAGFIWYMGIGGQMDISEQPLLAGFDAITISLLAYNNPVGLVLSSFFYGTLSAGSAAIPTQFVGLPKETTDIIIGILVYGAAISIAFSRLNVFRWSRDFINLSRYKKYRNAAVDLWSARWTYFVDAFKVQSKINSVKSQNGNKWKKINEEFKQKLIDIEKSYFEKYKDSGMKKFDVKLMTNEDQLIYFDKLATLSKDKNERLASEHYFEKNIFKAERVEKFKVAKEKFATIKKEMLLENNKILATTRELRKASFFKPNSAQAEEIILTTWFEVNSIDLAKENISKNKVEKSKLKITKFAKKYQKLDLIQGGM